MGNQLLASKTVVQEEKPKIRGVVPVPTAATTGTVVVTVGGLASNGISFTVGPSGAITLTQHTNINTSGTSAALAFASNNTGGNFIAVAVRAFQTNQTITVTDTVNGGVRGTSPPIRVGL